VRRKDAVNDVRRRRRDERDLEREPRELGHLWEEVVIPIPITSLDRKEDLPRDLQRRFSIDET
jgi:hypothetical protein